MSSQFFVKGDEHDEDELGTLYSAYEFAAALEDFFRRVQFNEGASLVWSS